MTIFGSNIREELTSLLAEHLRAGYRKRFLAGEELDWNVVAEEAMDFTYGQEPDSETPQTSGNDPEPGTEGCCGGAEGGGDRCPDPGDGTGVRDALTGVVDPPTSQDQWLRIRRGGIPWPSFPPSLTGEPFPGPGSGCASTAQSPQGPDSAGE